MPNHLHIATLRRGVLAWNEWREQAIDTIPDLTGADLQRADLTGANFAGTVLSMPYSLNQSFAVRILPMPT